MSVIADLSITCHQLLDTDYLSKTDPQVVVYAVDASRKRGQLLGRTECISNTLSPIFGTKISILDKHKDSDFEFVVRDSDHIGCTEIGRVYLSLRDVLSSPRDSGYVQVLESLFEGKGNGEVGSITIKALNHKRPRLSIKMSGRKIKKMDLLSESDPYITINQTGKHLYRSERIKDSKNPDWEDFFIQLEDINLEERCLILCYDCDGLDARGKDDFIGQAYVTFSELVGMTIPKEYEFRDKKNKVSGYLIVSKCLAIK